MTKYTGRLLSICAVAVLAACGGDNASTDSALAVDTSMARDLALAGQDTAAQPQLTDVPAAPSGGAEPKGLLGQYAADTWRSFDAMVHDETGLPWAMPSRDTFSIIGSTKYRSMRSR